MTKTTLIVASDIIYQKDAHGVDIVLGKGRLGYLKKATLKGKDVVVKTFVIENVEDKQSADPLAMASIFLQEAKNMKKFQHPRIVGLVGIVFETSSIVMEYMPGGSLHQYIQTIMKRMQIEQLSSTELFPWSERTMIALDIAQGMAFLHSKYTKDGKMKRDLFHQYLKSSHVLLYTESDRLRAKIACLGSNRVAHLLQNPNQVEINQIHVKAADLPYMAPEVISNQKFTKQCDVYAYGVILLELVLLLGPKDAISDCRIKLQKIQSEDSVPCLKDMCDLALACIELDPVARCDFKNIHATLSKKILHTSSQDLLHQTPKLHRHESNRFISKLSSLNHTFIIFDRFNVHTSDQKKSQNYLQKRRVIQWAAFILLILLVITVVLATRNGSSSATTVSSNSTIALNQTDSNTTLNESKPFHSTSSNFAGVNSLNLFAVSESDQIQVISALRNANVKVVRMHVTATFNGEKSSSSKAIPDLEPSTVGSYDDRILQAIDATLYRLHSYGLKAIIAFHDRHAMGCYTLRDAYYHHFKLPSKSAIQDCNDASKFYTNATAITAFENRIKHILDYSSPSFNGTFWSQLDQVIYGFDIQNRAQLGNFITIESWWCDRATMIKPLLKSTIKVITGGADYAQSFLAELGQCSTLDIIGFNHYFTINDINMIFGNVTQFRSQFKKPVLLEQFRSDSFSSNRSLVIRSVASVAIQYNVSWIVHQVMKRNISYQDSEFYTEDTQAWSTLKEMAMKY